MNPTELSRVIMAFKFVPDGSGGFKLSINTNVLLELLTNQGIEVDSEILYGFLLNFQKSLVGVPATKEALVKIAEVIWETAKTCQLTDPFPTPWSVTS